jgi:GDP-4-dehydro-6-deoxy-D-mannose reductase
MKFLVTGAEGFAGKHLVDLLTKCDHVVEHFDLDITYRSQVEFVIKDFQPDGVFNLAAKTHPPTSFQEPVEYFEVNANGAIYLVDAVLKYSPNTFFMQCSTSEVYGIHPEGTQITEKTICVPPNPYAVGKYAADLYVQERCNNGLLKGFITRAFSHTGPGRSSNYSISSDAIQIARILKRNAEPVIKVGNLSCKRVVMDVRDVVNVYYHLMMLYINGNSDYFGGVFNIGGDTLRTMGDYLNIMLDISGVKATTEINPLFFRKFDIPIQYPNSDKVRKILNWKPTIPIEKTLLDLIEYWKDRV